MKYKVGDRVKIKTWKKLKHSYGLSDFGNILSPPASNGTFFARDMENDMKTIAPDRILTIAYINRRCYSMKEITNWDWCDHMIEGIVKEKYIIFDSIEYRFKLMDFE